MTELYGVGTFFQLIQDHFLVSRMIFFSSACIFASHGYTFPFFFFILVELFIYLCQYIGPIIDQKRKNQFEKWIDDQIKATGAESANCLNKLLEIAWEPMFPQTFSPYFSGIIEKYLNILMPKIFHNIKVRSFLFGKRPPKVIQAITEEQPDQNSMSVVAAAVFAQDMSLTVDFTIFRIPFTLTIKNVVMYAPIRVIIETPQNPNYLYLPPISAFAFTATEDIVYLSSDVILNGFNAAKLPVINFLWCYLIEHFMRIVLSNGESVVWNFVTGEWSLRHATRPNSALSEKIFEGIADRAGDEKLGRFSMSEQQLAAFNETRKILWDRLYTVKIPPTECLIQVGPNHGQDGQPLLPFKSKIKHEYADIEIQVNESDLPPQSPSK